jgi:hypothetical protein
VANLLLAHLDDLDLAYPEVDLPLDELRSRIASGVTAKARAGKQKMNTR